MAAELDPLGMDAGAFHLIAPPPPASNHPPLKEARSYPGFGGIGSGMCQLDDIDIPCDMAMTMMSSGSGVPCPPEGCGPQVRGGKLQPLTVDPKTGRLVYGHWESTNGGVERDPSTQEVIRTYPERPHFVADGVAVMTTFFVLNIGDASRERLTDHGTSENPEQPQTAPRGKFPCPPTGEQLTKNPYIDQAFQAANQYARSAGGRGFVEAGGWILMDRKGNLSYFIKPREDRDYGTRVYGLGEPEKYIPNYSRGGDIVITDFHTHVNELRNPDEIGIANARGTPGIWVYPSGRAEAYGPNRGFRGRALPKGCK